MVTIGGYDVQQVGMIGAAAVGLAAVAIWRLRPLIGDKLAALATAHAGGPAPPTKTDPPAPPDPASVSDSDRLSPPGARQWVGEILAALDGAPDSLKLAALVDPTTTVASAQRKYIDHLRGGKGEQ